MFFLVLMCSCALVTCASAQVVVESDMFAESDLGLEELEAADKMEKAVIETDLILKGDAKIFEQSAPVISREEIVDAPVEIDQEQILSEQEMLRINDSLRRAIEQSRRLKEEKNRLDQELRTLRGEQRLDRRRFEIMEMEVKDSRDRMQGAARMKDAFDKTIEDMQDKIQKREQGLLMRIQELQQELDARRLAAGEMPLETQDALTGHEGPDTGLDVPAFSPKDVLQGQTPAGQTPVIASDDGSRLYAADSRKIGLDVIDLLNDLDAERQKIREDEAKVYYNMGNIFFHQGKYPEAVAEYQKALDLSPDDVNAHFNLAYISAEILKDYETALEHYQHYLYVNPAAEDKALVQDKILELQMIVGSEKNSPRDKEVRDEKKKRMFYW